MYFAAIAAASVGILIGKLVNPPGGWYKTLIQEAFLTKLHKQAEESPGWVDDVWIGSTTHAYTHTHIHTHTHTHTRTHARQPARTHTQT